MSLNVPVLALSMIGVLMVAAGLFTMSNFVVVLFGLLTVFAAWILQELTKRRA